jgi:hypothetical protein
LKRSGDDTHFLIAIVQNQIRHGNQTRAVRSVHGDFWVERREFLPPFSLRDCDRSETRALFIDILTDHDGYDPCSMQMARRKPINKEKTG